MEFKKVEKEVAFLLIPLMYDDLFYYSRELKNYRKNEKGKTPSTVVEELSEKVKHGRYVTYKEAL